MLVLINITYKIDFLESGKLAYLKDQLKRIVTKQCVICNQFDNPVLNTYTFYVDVRFWNYHKLKQLLHSYKSQVYSINIYNIWNHEKI